MGTVFVALLLALAWLALTGEFSPLNLIVGLALGGFILWLTQPGGRRQDYLKKIGIVLNFALFFLWELLLANIRMAVMVLRSTSALQPGIIAVPLDLDSDVEITLLANLITLTPGTLTLDVSDDKKMLYVHAAYIKDADEMRHNIKHGFERRIKELFA